MSEPTPEEALAHNAAKAAKLALFCLVVAVLVLAIDHRLKKHIIDEGKRALALLEEARKLAEEAKQGGLIWASGPDGAAAGAGVDAGDGVVHAPAAPEAANNHAAAGPGAAADHTAGARRRAPRDG